ncbi:MAG: LPS-assembly protein LptD, partial [Candidatus Aminicenantales bacterium]
MRAKRAFPLSLFLCYLVGGNLLIGQSLPSSNEVRILAQYKEKSGTTLLARGNVEIHYRNITLLVDEVQMDTETREVWARGNVSLLLPDENLSCEEARFNLNSSEGELKKVFGSIQPTIFYQAETIRRETDDLYRFEKAKITSCAQPVPRWQFSCSRANFRKDDYMEMWNAVFRIKKVPVFYLPYMRYPLDRERSTGFLIPQVGYSGPKGVYYSQSFYWAIKRNMDSTLNLDYYSERGFGGGLEYRYLFSETTRGQLNLYYFQFKNRAPVESPENAYILRVKHNQQLPLDFHLVADVDYQSSYDFLREFDNNFRRAVVSNRRSQVYLSRAWSYFNLNVRVSRF